MGTPDCQHAAPSFDWGAYYDRLIGGGMSHREAIHWTNAADADCAMKSARNGHDRARLQRTMSRIALSLETR